MKKELLPVALIASVIIFSMLIYPSLPELIPSHWNAQGEIDSYSSKDFTVFFFPGLILGIYLLMLIIPRFDPLKRNYPSFSAAYYWFRVVFIIFFSALYLFTIWTALGGNLNMNYFMIPAMSLLFIVMGLFLPKIKKNYFVGIKTPWTLASEESWNKTHALGGKLFVLAGAASLLGLFFKGEAMWILILLVIAAVIIAFVYSYIVYRKVEASKNNN
jgi:uncharacterized membrane protein